MTLPSAKEQSQDATNIKELQVSQLQVQSEILPPQTLLQTNKSVFIFLWRVLTIGQTNREQRAKRPRLSLFVSGDIKTFVWFYVKIKMWYVSLSWGKIPLHKPFPKLRYFRICNRGQKTIFLCSFDHFTVKLADSYFFRGSTGGTGGTARTAPALSDLFVGLLPLLRIVLVFLLFVVLFFLATMEEKQDASENQPPPELQVGEMFIVVCWCLFILPLFGNCARRLLSSRLFAGPRISADGGGSQGEGQKQNQGRATGGGEGVGERRQASRPGQHGEGKGIRAYAF